MDFKTVQSLLQANQTTAGFKLNFVKGQIFFGQILKLFPSNQALVQLGGTEVHAKLEAPLVAGRSYWFRVVQAKEGIPQLKVFQSNEGVGKNSQPASILLKGLGLSFSKSQDIVVKMLMDEKQPFSKEIIIKGGEWLKTVENKQAALGTIRQMAADRSLPLTRTVFEALLTGREGKQLHKQIGQLVTTLNKTSEEFPVLQKLRELLPKLILKPSTSGMEIKQPLQRLIAQLGLSFEHDLIQKQDPQLQQTLKPLLLQTLAQTQPGEVRHQVQQLLTHLTSQQLNSTGPFQAMVQIPIQSGNRVTDLTIRWEGKKQKDGRFDPNFCRILFYLDLEHLQATAVDVNIQKRLINIRIFNETHDLQDLIERFEPLLQEKLELAGYQLSSVKQAEADPTKLPWNSGEDPINGVDVRV